VKNVDFQSRSVGMISKPVHHNAARAVTTVAPALDVKNDAIFSVLNRFKMIRLVSRCFRYTVQTRAQWG
jgi:hypothetical protein